MSIHIQQVLDYLDSQGICQQADNMEALMEVLHDAYVKHNSIDDQQLCGQFQSLRQILDRLPAEYGEAFFCQVCDLCLAHEQLAFSQGVVVGMLLMTEVNRIP